LVFRKQESFFRLQGSTLTRFADNNSSSQVEKVTVLENREWEVTTPKGIWHQAGPVQENQGKGKGNRSVFS